jgi:uncharacterized protein (TIGR04255 family)
MGEKLANAPVFFTIAQVRHNPILSVQDYLTVIQESMRREGYPDYKRVPSFQIVLPQPASGEASQVSTPAAQQVERYLFSTLDGTRGFIVELGALSLQTTEYETYEAFSGEFFKGLRIIHEALKLDYTERVGIRYLDAVVPPTDKEIGEYLVPGALGISAVLPDSVQVTQSFSQTDILTPVGTLIARAIIRNGPLGFPIDLQPLGLNVAERFSKIQGVHAILDTDAYYFGREKFDVDALQSRFRALHDVIGTAFWATVTNRAKEAFSQST